MPVAADPPDLSAEAIFHSPPRFSERGTPTWEVAYLFPSHGAWTENEYLALDTNWLVEFTDGSVEVLSKPTVSHQRITRFSVRQLEDYSAAEESGEVFRDSRSMWRDCSA